MPKPTLEVKLDDGTGTWPYDITNYVRLDAGVTVTPGRSDEFGTIDGTVLNLTLKNDDGRFTLGRAGGPYPIDVGMPIRVRLQKSGGSWSTRFIGNVGTWPVEWPGGKTATRAAITATDRFARLARRFLYGTLIENDVYADKPDGFWPGTDAAGSRSADDASGNNVADLVQVGSGSPVTFGYTGLPADESHTAMSFNGGKGLQVPIALGSTFTTEVVFCCPTPPSGAVAGVLATPYTLFRTDAGPLVTINSLGNLAGSVQVCDGAVHVCAIEISAGGATLEIFVDGVSLGAGSSGGISGPLVIGEARGQYGSGVAPNFSPFVGSIMWVNHYTSLLSAARLASHAAAVLNAYSGETSDVRLARLALWAGIATADQAFETGVQTLGPMVASTDTSMLDAMRLVEAAEQGLLLVNGAGQLVLQNRSHRYNRATAITFAADKIGNDARFTGDDQGLINQATATRDGGVPQIARNPASIAKYELYPTDVSPPVLTDEEARQIASWLVAIHSSPVSRLSSAKADLFTNVASFSDAMLDLNISDLISITTLPSPAVSSSVSLFVEGWTETIALTAWEMDLNTTPGAAGQVFQLDVTPIDSVYRLAL